MQCLSLVSVLYLVITTQALAKTNVVIGKLVSGGAVIPLPVQIEPDPMHEIIGVQLGTSGYFHTGANFASRNALSPTVYFNDNNSSNLIFVDIASFYPSGRPTVIADINSVKLIKSDGTFLKETDFTVVNKLVSYDVDMVDFDNDGISNAVETSLGMNIYSLDSDGDGLLDNYEYQHAGLDPIVNDANADADSDGMSNIDEYLAGTDATNADSDFDGMNDGDEIAIGRDPLLNEPAILVVINGLILG